MNENNQRKTLVSIKVSTLLLIVLVVVILIVVGVVIATNSNKTEYKEENTNKVSNEVDKVSEVTEVNTSKATGRNGMAITARSSDSRTDGTTIAEEVEEAQEEAIEKAEEAAVIEEPVVQTTPIEDVKISKDMDLTVRTGLSRDDFILLISGVREDTSNFFEENAGLIYDVCEKYEINEIFFCGLISAESGWAIASNHRNTHNYISLMSGNGLIKFATVEEGIEKAAQVLHDNYLTPGARFYYGKTLAGVKTKFCPASSTWVNLVYQRMAQIVK